MRLIDKDELAKVKFHPLPYTHIVPTDAEVESYERGWNDAIDAIIDNAPTIEELKIGRWKDYPIADGCIQCSVCGALRMGEPSNYCPNCGAKMEAVE